MEFSQGSSFAFGFKKRASKAPLLNCKVEIAFALKEASSQLTSKAKKENNKFLWKLLEFLKAFLEMDELMML